MSYYYPVKYNCKFKVKLHYHPHTFQLFHEGWEKSVRDQVSRSVTVDVNSELSLLMNISASWSIYGLLGLLYMMGRGARQFGSLGVE